MKLELAQGYITEELAHELDFDGFLELFNYSLNAVPRLILRPLTEAEAFGHFERLQSVYASFQPEQIDHLCGISQQLPFIDRVLPFLESGELQQYHLYLLGTFIEACLKLEKQEATLPISASGLELCHLIKNYLLECTEEGYGAVRLSEKEQRLKLDLQEIVEQRHLEMQACEKKVQADLGVNVIYAHPKELPWQSELWENAIVHELVSCNTECENGFMRLELKMSAALLEINGKYQLLEKEYEDAVAEIMTRLNHWLQSLSTPFSEYVKKRLQRCVDYCIIKTMYRERLVLPQISPQLSFCLKNGRLPVLQNKIGERLKPLNINLTAGSSVIFGANMSGKTTVLKTVYFFWQVFRFGLPVPCEQLVAHFPSSLELLLKSSGRLDNLLSSFGTELEFFAREVPDKGVILTDELFQSTDPDNGSKLAQIFVDEFNTKNCVFLCTTHYLRILETNTSAKIFRMKDIDFKDKIDYHSVHEELVKRLPYEIEEISPLADRRQSFTAPLEIALLFPLDQTIKGRIKSYLDKAVCKGKMHKQGKIDE